MSSRARPLPPLERRAVVIETTRELIRQRGELPSTREIAEASGIAEGTLFRAFPTKEELVEAVVAATFCPAPVLRQLDEIDATLPLHERLVAVATVLQQRLSDVFDVMVGLRLLAPPPGRTGEHQACTSRPGHVPSPAPRAGGSAGARGHDWGEPAGEEGVDRATARVAALLEPDAHQLRYPPAEVARYLRLLTFSGSHRQLTHGRLLDPETIVAVILDGVLDRRPASRRRAGGIPASPAGGIPASPAGGIPASPAGGISTSPTHGETRPTKGT